MASTIKVNNIQNQCGANIVNKCSTTITLGASGDNIALACGATQSGFGRTGTVNWNTTAITADPANAVSGTGYFANTTSAAFTITLPTSPSAGDIVAISDYASNFGTNNLTVGRNGSNIEGDASDYVLNQDGVSVTLVYVDATKGWIVTNAGNSSQGFVSDFIEATGGTITTCGDYKIHTFTSPGSFVVSNGGTPAGSNTVDYLIVAGGGGTRFGGGGAGGVRASATTYTNSGPSAPRTACVAATPVTATSYPITVGAGGAAGSSNPGSNSSFNDIVAAGGASASLAGGSGGGGGATGTPGGIPGGAGNTPPVSPPQGSSGGNGSGPSGWAAGGGGGYMAAGSNSEPDSCGSNANGGNAGAGGGFPTAIGSNGVPSSCQQYFSGGGGGFGYGGGGSGGLGGGGNGSNGPGTATSGTANTGGGAGGGLYPCKSGSGGSGIVIIRYKYQ